PTLLGYLGEARSLAGTPGRTQSDNADSRTRLDVLEGLIYTALSGLSDELAAGSRHTGDLETQLGSKLADMNISIRSYLQSIRGADGEQPQAIALGDGNRAFHIAVQNTLGVWAATETELERLLSKRIDTLNGRLRFSLLITGAFASLSIAIALMTHRH